MMIHAPPCHSDNIDDNGHDAHVWPLSPWHVIDDETNLLASVLIQFC